MPDPLSTARETLPKVPIFSGLTDSELTFLAQKAVPRRYAAGESVFGEGEPCSGLYVVESGHVRIFKSSANGREQVLSIDGPGSSIAELPVFDGGNYPASVTAIDDATLLFVSKQDFQALCLKHPQVALKVLRVVGSRLRRLVGIIEELSFTTVRHRLASFLLRLAQKEGKPAAKGVEVMLPCQQSGTGFANWHRPGTGVPQPFTPAIGGYAQDRRSHRHHLRFESSRVSDRLSRIVPCHRTLSLFWAAHPKFAHNLPSRAFYAHCDISHRQGLCAPLLSAHRARPNPTIRVARRT